MQMYYYEFSLACSVKKLKNKGERKKNYFNYFMKFLFWNDGKVNFRTGKP